MSEQGLEKAMEIIRAVAVLSEARYPQRRGHSRLVAHYAEVLGRALGLEPAELAQLAVAAYLHDVGYMSVPDSLMEREELSVWEQTVISCHTLIGYRLMRRLPGMELAAQAVRHHHENFDGTGYPDRLRGEEIPLGARIIAVAEILAHNLPARSWPTPQQLRQALDVARRLAGSKLDPKLVKTIAQALEPWLSQDIDALREQVERHLGEAMGRILESGARLPVVGQVLQRVKRLLARTSGEINSLVKMIELDPGLTIKVLTVANSPEYRGIRPIETVREAVVRLGMEEVASIVASLESHEIFLADRPGVLGSICGVWWREAVFMGVISRSLATLSELHESMHDKLYLAGVLRYIGRPVLLYTYQETHPLEGLEPFAREQLVEMVEDKAWGVSRWVLEQGRVPEDVLSLAMTRRMPRAGAQVDTPTKIIFIAEAMANLSRQLEAAEAIFAHYQELGRILESARLELPIASQLQALKRACDLCQVLFEHSR